MPVHSIIIINKITNNVLLSKYFDETITSIPGECLVFESFLYHHMEVYFKKMREGTISREKKFSLTITNIHVVFQEVGEVFIILCGTDDVDESILSDLLDNFKQVVQIIFANILSESLLMQPENVGKVLIAIDEMMSQGIVECEDAEAILKATKLK